MDATALSAATPATRQRSVDLVRAGSLLVVVLGHWLMAVVTWEDGRPHAANALADVPVARYATWLLQVMPLFFVVGGVANHLSLTRGGRSTGAWLVARAERLVRPTAVLLGAWTVAALALGRAGVDPAVVRAVTRGVTQPLWFLAVYLVVIALAPLTVRLHARAPLGTVAVLAGAAVVFDRVGPAAANYVVVWLLAHQLGFSWADGTLLRWTRRQALALAGAGFAALAVLTSAGGYPVSMVGLPGARSNMSPPTVCIVALTALQLGLLLAARPALKRWLARPRAWAVVARTGGMAMTVFLWHLTAYVLVAVPALAMAPAGPGVGTAAWWLARLAWVAAATTVLVVIVEVVGPVEWRHAPSRARTGGTGIAAAAVVTLAVGLLLVVTDGLTPFALGVVAAGIGLLRA